MDPQKYGRGSEQPLDDLRAEVAANGAAIAALKTRADGADVRADSTDERDSAQDTRMDGLQEHHDVDRAMILELQAEGSSAQSSPPSSRTRCARHERSVPPWASSWSVGRSTRGPRSGS